MHHGVLYGVLVLALGTAFSLVDGLVSLGTLAFALPGFAIALMPTLLAYLVAALGFVVFARRIQARPILGLLAAAPLLLLAVGPHVAGTFAFRSFAHEAVKGDFTIAPSTTATSTSAPKTFALAGFGFGATWCFEECQRLLHAGAGEVWIGGPDAKARYRLARMEPCPEFRGAITRAARQGQRDGRCIVTAPARTGSADVVIVSRRVPFDRALSQESNPRWRTWTVDSLTRFDVYERQGRTLRHVERTTRVEARVAGWPFLTLPTWKSGGWLYTAMNRNREIVNPGSAPTIIARRYSLTE